MITAIGTRCDAISTEPPLRSSRPSRAGRALDDELFPQRPDLQRSILQASPRIVSRNVQTQLKPTVQFLQSLNQRELLWEDAVTRNPDLLLTVGTGYKSDDGGLDLVERYLRHDLQVSPTKLQHLQRKAPLLFQVSVTQLLSVVAFFQQVLDQGNHDSSESSLPTIRRLLESHPNLFHLSVSENLKPRLEYLKERGPLSDADVVQLLHKKTSSAAAILGLSVRDNLQPTLDLLSELLLVHHIKLNNGSNRSSSNLRKTILTHPQILGLSLSNLRLKIAYFDSIDNNHSDLGTTNKRTPTKKEDSACLASRVLMRSPAVYSLSLRDNIVPTVEYLKTIWGIADAKDDNKNQNLRNYVASWRRRCRTTRTFSKRPCRARNSCRSLTPDCAPGYPWMYRDETQQR